MAQNCCPSIYSLVPFHAFHPIPSVIKDRIMLRVGLLSWPGGHLDAESCT
jgi:hypothetical protein